ncbi:MAG: NADH-quinone oxidoreductase subunit D [Bacteroidales bacterium]|nr:NADH-quinone oxidoreductase subunit D [Bacteroidales bacterium]MBR5531893.1 NADH-quinone oxidoreductase subunit D [Bacteroidales bacterium]
MSNIYDKIKAIVPEVTIEENGLSMVVVPSEKMPIVASYLSEKESFDSLVALIGNDWGDSLGVVYIIDSTATNERVVLKTSTTDKENPMLYSVVNVWQSADLNEREVYDFYGIRFIGHPDMRRIFLREDWEGYPLRKDYDMSPEANPVPQTNEYNADTTISLQEQPDGTIKEEERVVFAPEDYVVNIGPQHPATHGVMRFRTAIEGETIKKIDPICGYIHRGVEKLAEGLTYPQTLHFTDRLDYLSAHQNRHALCMCIEEAMGIEVPERAKYIRTIMDELSRIGSHLLLYSTLCMDLGSITAFIYGFRDRDKILDIFDDTCGGRLIMNYNKIGGVMADIHPEFVTKVKNFIKYMPKGLAEYHALFSGNIIARNRMEGVGVLSKEDAIKFGIFGPTGRASGWANDVRKLEPYGVYDKVDFEQVVLTEGDTYARYMIRLKEIEQSMHIIEQLIDNIPEGDYAAKTKPIIKLPEGNFFKRVEGARGAFGVYIESKGDKTPYRMKFVSQGLNLIGAVDHITRDSKIADLIAIGGSLDYVIPDIDR